MCVFSFFLLRSIGFISWINELMHRKAFWNYKGICKCEVIFLLLLSLFVRTNENPLDEITETCVCVVGRLWAGVGRMWGDGTKREGRAAEFANLGYLLEVRKREVYDFWHIPSPPVQLFTQHFSLYVLLFLFIKQVYL